MLTLLLISHSRRRARRVLQFLDQACRSIVTIDEGEGTPHAYAQVGTFTTDRRISD